MAILRISTMAAASVGFLAGFAAGAGLMAVRMGEQPISTAGAPGHDGYNSGIQLGDSPRGFGGGGGI